MTSAQEALAQEVLARHSKSFALAGKLLPAWCRSDAAVLYAWCRRCDDSVDFDDGSETAAAAAARRVAEVDRLRRELDLVFGGQAQTDPVLAAFQEVVFRHEIPQRYADELVSGMAMDTGVVRYGTFSELLLYCYRAAGTVGLMMAHVMKVRDPAALRRAADLGIAMQLTNICRDVVEDERRGRVYLPRDLLGEASMPSQNLKATAEAVAEILRRASLFYRSGDLGLTRLPLRCAIAIGAARAIYADIGSVIARRKFDVTAGRAVVSRARKIWLLVAAAVQTLAGRLISKFRRRAWPPNPYSSPLVVRWAFPRQDPPPRLGRAAP